MLSETDYRFTGIMSFFISIVFIGLIAAGCSTTTYLNLKENNQFYIERHLKKVEKGKDVGAEVSLLLKDEKIIYGELLSVRGSSLIICTEHSAMEKELTNLTYPIILVQNEQIQKLTIEGRSYVWWGLGAGYLTGPIIGYLLGQASASGSKSEKKISGLFSGIIGGFVCATAGWIIGYALSTEEYVLKEIPPDYEFYFLKSLARYSDEEPEYLKSLK